MQWIPCSVAQWILIEYIGLQESWVKAEISVHTVSISTSSLEPPPTNFDSLPHAAWNPLHSPGMHYTLLHEIGCTQRQCMEAIAFNRYQLQHAEWNPLHSIEIHCTTLHTIHCIQSRCMGYTAFNRHALVHAA